MPDARAASFGSGCFADRKKSRPLNKSLEDRAERALSPMYGEKGPNVMTTRLLIAAFVTAGLASPPFAAEAKKYEHIINDVSAMQSYGTPGLSTTQPKSYGTSGTSIGTVTAPSVGSYSWPSVGVTNAVPTWSNTNPPVR